MGLIHRHDTLRRGWGGGGAIDHLSKTLIPVCIDCRKGGASSFVHRSGRLAEVLQQCSHCGSAQIEAVIKSMCCRGHTHTHGWSEAMQGLLSLADSLSFQGKKNKWLSVVKPDHRFQPKLPPV